MAHIHQDYDYTTSAYIVYDDKVLLVHHKKIGKWLQPGGHIELDENPIEALYRELYEETGIHKDNLEIIDLSAHTRPAPSENSTILLPLPLDFNVHNFNESHKHIDLGYLVKAAVDTVVLEESGAFDIGWHTKKDMRQRLDQDQMFPHTYKYACLAIDYIKAM